MCSFPGPSSTVPGRNPLRFPNHFPQRRNIAYVSLHSFDNIWFGFSLLFHIAGWRMDGWWQKWFSGWLAHGHVRGTAPPGNAIYCQHASAGTAILSCNGVKTSHCIPYSNIELDWIHLVSQTTINAKGLSVKSGYYTTIHELHLGDQNVLKCYLFYFVLYNNMITVLRNPPFWLWSLREGQAWCMVDIAGRELTYKISYLICMHILKTACLPKP